MLTPEKIAELRKLLAEATPGDWKLVYRDDDTRWERMAGVLKGDTVLEIGPVFSDDIFHYHSDAALIAAMKTVLPALLDAAEELARVHQWARQPHVCGGTCTNAMNGGNCGTCTSGGRNAEYKDEPGWTDNFKPEWNRERRDIPPTQAFREMREEFGHHFDGIDVDKFCHDVRYGTDEEATK